MFMREYFLAIILWHAFSCFISAGSQLKPEDVSAHIEALLEQPRVAMDLYVVDSDLSDEHRDWLEKRLEVQKKAQLEREYSYSVEEIEQNGSLGMAILSVRNETNPLFLQTLPVAFCRMKNSWKAAPVHGSFALSGFGTNSTEEIEARDYLEKWVSEAEEKISKRLRSELDEHYASEVAKHRKAGMPLTDGTDEDVVEYFIEMCRERDFYGVLACLSKKERDPRNEVLISEAFLSTKSKWSGLLHKNFAYWILSRVDDFGGVSVGMFMPTQTKTQQIMEFEVVAHEDGWSVILPESLNFEKDGRLRKNTFRPYRLSRKNRDRVKLLKSSLVEALQASELGAEVDGVRMLLHAIKERDFQLFLNATDWHTPLMDGQKTLSNENAEQRFTESLKLWNSLTKSSTLCFKELERNIGMNSMVVQSLVYSVSKPESMSVQAMLYAVKGQHTRLVPEFDPKKLSDEWIVSQDQIDALVEYQQRQLDAEFRRILEKAVYLSEDQVANVEDDHGEQIEKFCNEFLKALKEEDTQQQSRFLALHRGSEKSVLSVLGSMVSEATNSTRDYYYHTNIRSNKLVFAVFEIRHRDSSESQYVALPMVRTESVGLRFLLVYQYLYEHGRGEKIINRKVVKLAKEYPDTEFSKDYFKLVEKFNTAIQSKLMLDKKENE